MYCMREGDTWWCITDEDMHKSEDALAKLRFFKKFGKEYFINSEGNYEIREDEDE